MYGYGASSVYSLLLGALAVGKYVQVGSRVDQGRHV